MKLNALKNNSRTNDVRSVPIHVTLPRLRSLILALSGVLGAAVFHPANAATTTVSGSSSGVTVAADGDAVTVENTGTVNSPVTMTGNGITNAYSGVYIENNGDITGYYYAVRSTGSIDTLVNNGNMTGTNYSGIYNETGTITTLTNTGQIEGHNTGIRNTGTITTINNSGTVTGSGYAAIDNAPGTISLITNSGSLIGGLYGITNLSSSTIGTIENSGSIQGGTYGIYNNASTINLISNSGTITGTTAIWNYGGTIGSLTNSGTLTGSSYSIYSTGTIGTLTNSGTIRGNIYNGSSSDWTINGGSGSTYGTLTGYSGIGLITNTASNLIFGSGNLILNDNINVGTYTVTNQAASLQINNSVTVTGNYSQNSTASLIFGVADNAIATGDISTDSGYGRLYVTGDTTLAAGSTISLTTTGSTYSFAQGQRYVVIVTSGTANYNTSSLNYSASGYSGTVTGSTVVDGTATDLVLTLSDSTGTSSSPVNSATNSNSKSAIDGLFRYTGVDTSLLNVFNATAALGSSSAANSAGAQLSPVANVGSAAKSSSSSTDAVINVINAHVDGLRLAQRSGASGMSAGDGYSDIAMWGQIFGGKSNQGERDNVSGYYSSYKGVLLGADQLVSDRWRVGSILSYAHTSLRNTGDNSGSSASADSYGLMGYAGYTTDNYYVDLSAGAVSHHYNTVRDINFTGFSGTALGSFNGLQYVTSVRAGRPFQLDEWIDKATLTPIVGLSYSALRQGGYSETGGNGAALSVSASRSTSLKSELGAKFERLFQIGDKEVVPSIQLGWKHEFHGNAQQMVASYVDDSSGSTSFSTQGASAIRNTGVMALALSLVNSGNLTLSARYTLEGASGYTAQTADVRLRYQF